MSLTRNTVKLLLALCAAVVLAIPVAGCGRDEPNLETGKSLFVERCGSCHALARAGTQGQTGPDLDSAFAVALRDGMSRDTVEGVVHKQIANVRRGSVMPPDLVTGQDAEDVAAYVAYATSRTGEDEGALAQAGLAGAKSGEQIFTAAGCASCHTFKPAGATGDVGPDLDDLASAIPEAGKTPEQYVQEALTDPDAFVVEGFQKGVMPSYEGRLSEEQIKALGEYLLGN